MGAGAGAQKITTDVTGNDTAGMVAGMVASGVTAKGLNGIEAEANKLAKAPKGIDGVTEEAGNLAEDVISESGVNIRGAGDESGINFDLLDELANSGVKYNPEDIVAITKTADGKLVWLENGTDTAGLNHIITEHADDFLNKGITQEQIPDYIMNALENGKIVGYQGRGTGRPIYEFTYNGEIHKVAITVGNNGFIVGANPK